jgi:rod shape-determining protein MreB and related proteins
MGSLAQLTGLRDCDIAVDLGTTTTLIDASGRGIVLVEPSLVAVKPRTREIVAVGIGAERLLERESDSLMGVRPLEHGTITDFDLAVEMLRRFKRSVCRSRRAHPRMVVGVPSGATDVGRRAVHEACLSAGASEANLIEGPMAAAIGAGLPVAEAVGSLVVDIGGGITEVALISLREIVAWRSIPVGGDDLDAAIVKHLRREHGLLVSQRTAEEVKRRVGFALRDEDDNRVEVCGCDTRSAMPKTAVLTSEEIGCALERHVVRIVEAVKETLSCTPPELSSDILDRGTVLVGGGALLKGLEERLRQETHMPAQVAELPLTCAAAGSGVWLEELKDGRFQEVIESCR